MSIPCKIRMASRLLLGVALLFCGVFGAFAEVEEQSDKATNTTTATNNAVIWPSDEEEAMATAVVYSTEYPGSLKIARHYLEKRNIPTNNLIAISPAWSGGIQRSDYENQLEKQRVVAAEELYPQALEEYQNSLKSGAAFTAFVSRQSTYTAFNRDGFVSFLRNYFESGGESDRLMLHAETFSLPDCGLIIADDLFSVSEEEYLGALAQNVCSIIDAGGGSGYYENCSALAERALQKEDFYLSENGLVIFYQAATLAPASLGPMQFTIPYNSLEDIFVLW